MALAKTPQLHRYITHEIIKPLYKLGYVYISGTYNRDYTKYITDIDIIIKNIKNITNSDDLLAYIDEMYAILINGKNVIISVEYPKGSEATSSILKSINNVSTKGIQQITSMDSISDNMDNNIISVKDIDIKTKWHIIKDVASITATDLAAINNDCRMFVITYLAPIFLNSFVKIEATIVLPINSKPDSNVKKSGIDELALIRCSRSRQYFKKDILKAFKRLYSCYVILESRYKKKHNNKQNENNNKTIAIILSEMNDITSIINIYQLLMSAVEQLDVFLNLAEHKHPAAIDKWRKQINGTIINQITKLKLGIRLDTSNKLTPTYIDKLRHAIHLELQKRHNETYITRLDRYKQLAQSQSYDISTFKNNTKTKNKTKNKTKTKKQKQKQKT